ncbi:hypothetical protein QJQ45_014281 [Haematococcus lacustris]|nr:hypothetical protein QJQ45_014281 [Haematococcus lacustris]
MGSSCRGSHRQAASGLASSSCWCTHRHAASGSASNRYRECIGKVQQQVVSLGPTPSQPYPNPSPPSPTPPLPSPTPPHLSPAPPPPSLALGCPQLIPMQGGYCVANMSHDKTLQFGLQPPFHDLLLVEAKQLAAGAGAAPGMLTPPSEQQGATAELYTSLTRKRGAGGRDRTQHVEEGGDGWHEQHWREASGGAEERMHSFVQTGQQVAGAAAPTGTQPLGPKGQQAAGVDTPTGTQPLGHQAAVAGAPTGTQPQDQQAAVAGAPTGTQRLGPWAAAAGAATGRQPLAAMDAIEVNNARDMRRRTARRRWKQIILQVLLSVVQWVVEEGLVVKRQAIHVAHCCHPRIFDVVVLLGRRRYNRVSEYWKEPRNYKTLYPNVIEVMGPVAREKQSSLPALMRNLDCPEVVRGGRLLQSLMNGRSDADPNPSLNSSRPAAEPDGTNGKARGSYTVRYQGHHILHKCAHRQHVEVEALVFRNLRNMGSAKLDLRGGLLAALVENAGSAGDAEEDNGLYTALFGMLCCLTDFQRPDLSVAAGQAITDCFIAFIIEHNIKKGEVTVTVQHAKAAGKGRAPRRKPAQEGVEEHVPPLRQARVGTRPTTHNMFGGPQMSAISHHLWPMQMLQTELPTVMQLLHCALDDQTLNDPGGTFTGRLDCEKAFLSRFHMSSELFKKVCTAILGHPLLERNCNRKDFLTIAEQLGVFCTFAAQGGSYTQVALAMGCSTTSVSRCVNNVSTAIWDRLSMKIAWPRTEEELRTNVLGFEELSGLVQVVGAIDGTHVRLASVPANGGHDYYCHKGFHSIVAQAVVNHQGKAMDVHVGHAGRAHDANVFSDSPVGRQLLDRGSEIAQALSRSMQSVGGVNVPRQLVADSAYPTREHMLPAFKKTIAELDPDRAHFNEMHKKARIRVEHFWGWLKHKFGPNYLARLRAGLLHDVPFALQPPR